MGYVALALRWDGQKEVLGLWFGGAEGAKFWLTVVRELQNRRLKDLLIACVDGLKSFPEAIESVFPQTVIQLCVVHLARHSLKLVSDKERKAVAADLKRIYRAATLVEAEQELSRFEQKWSERYPLIGKSGRSNWGRIAPMFEYPAEIRRVIYTTNAIESLNSTLRRAVNPRTLFPTEGAAFKVLYLALERVSRKWTMPLPEWKRALQQFALLFGERVPLEW
jgi:putative transposase